MTLLSRLRYWTSPSRSTRWAATALGLTLVLTHRLVVREHRDARLLAIATHVCQIQAEKFAVPPRPARKEK